MPFCHSFITIEPLLEASEASAVSAPQRLDAGSHQDEGPRSVNLPRGLDLHCPVPLELYTCTLALLPLEFTEFLLYSHRMKHMVQ